ncbi:MAG TPA: hypothetical protein VFI54_16270 [Solirubrobacteraceae bacterium]|nr:hypothetical protein [Solirubrobacteraceae bacterium]
MATGACRTLLPVLYLVSAPAITHVRTHQLSGSWVKGGVERGGASFAQHSPDPPTVIITGLVESPADLVGYGLSEPESLRPAGVVHDRLAAIRYPDEYASYTSSDWDHWAREVKAEADASVADDARWTPSRVMVDDDLHEGVQTSVDRRFAAAAFYLPEERLDVGIERLGPPEHFRDLDQLTIVRSRDLDVVDWDYRLEDDEDD